MDRILSATKEAPLGHEFDFSKIDKSELANDTSLRVAICVAGHEVADKGLRKSRQKRREKFLKQIRDGRATYKADFEDDGRIAQCYSDVMPNDSTVFAKLEAAAKQATQPIIDPSHWGDLGPKVVSALTVRNRVETIVGQLAVVYEQHFGKKATYSNYRETSQHYEISPDDAMFPRFAREVMVELGLNNGERYSLGYICRALDESRAKNHRPRSKKKR